METFSLFRFWSFTFVFSSTTSPPSLIGVPGDKMHGEVKDNVSTGVSIPEIYLKCSTVHCSTVQYSTVQYSTVQYSTVQYSTVQYSTVQYSTVQYSTVQYSTVQYSTVSIPEINIKFMAIKYFAETCVSTVNIERTDGCNM